MYLNIEEEKNTSCFRGAVRVLYFRRAALVLKTKRRYEDVSDAAGVKNGTGHENPLSALLLDSSLLCLWGFSEWMGMGIG